MNACPLGREEDLWEFMSDFVISVSEKCSKIETVDGSVLDITQLPVFQYKNTVNQRREVQ